MKPAIGRVVVSPSMEDCKAFRRLVIVDAKVVLPVNVLLEELQCKGKEVLER
jgi:hypothetical protein